MAACPEQRRRAPLPQHEEKSDFNIYTKFLDAVRNETKEQVVECLSLLKSSTGTAQRTITEDEDSDEITTQADVSTSYRQMLLKALEQRNAGAVWNLIVEGKETDVKSLETLNRVCEYVAEHERLKESGLFNCLWGKLKSQISCNGGCGCCNKCCEKEQRRLTEFQKEEEQQWIKILSDPLYISLEWLWRNNPNSKTPPSSEKDGETKRKVSKLEDAIEAALHDAHLLKKIALHEHNYSRDEYTRRAEEYEKFAADVVEGSDLAQLHTIMDVKGTGCLLQERPEEFNESLSLLKIAADKERKKFVASPKCQSILNEIIYYECPHWQNMSRVTKFVWSLLQLIFVAISSVVYVVIRLLGKSHCFDKVNKRLWGFREFYEHPYSKFINHTTWYLVFLALVFTSSFEEEFGTTVTGLVWIDYIVLGFVIGLFLQEITEAWRQGFYIYMSKWWNVVDTLIILTFLLAYAIWIFSWVRFGKWKPQKSGFVVADVFYASGTVMAFFHLTHIFQVDSVLGPLQLSLYKMLKDVRRFLLIFLLLYIAFATGVVKVYSYYVASQIELRKQNNTIYQESHPYSNHLNTLNVLFWLLLGSIEEATITVDDPAFFLTSYLGRLFFMVYVVCTVIVALNMLIAMMNNSYERIMENADIEWKFSRAQMWLEWIDKGNTVPAPINIVYYFWEGIRRCVVALMDKCQCCSKCRNQQDEEQAMRKERMETMKDLIVKYLKENYFGKNEMEKDRCEDTQHIRDAATADGGSQASLQDINLRSGPN